MNWISVKDRLPKHKDLVLLDIGCGVSIPAIHYKNGSYNGFWKFTTYYHGTSPYSKVKIKDKHEIKDVKYWMPLPETN